MKLQVDKLKERNQALNAEVTDLKKGLDAIEERARSDLGMISQGEVYYQVIDNKPVTPARPESNADE